MREDSNTLKLRSSFSLFYKQNFVSVKIFVLLFLFFSLVFRLFPVQSSSPGVASLAAASGTPQKDQSKCDLFTGEWVWDPSGPVYTNRSCNWIVEPQNCMKNGRPDSDYLYWRWKPRDCELPKFNTLRFLERMKNKYMAFIGDSISRNHVQSLLCILSQVEPAREIYHDEGYKSRTWQFPSYNFTVAVIWSPFLVHADIFENDNGVSSTPIHLHFDKLDLNWTTQYTNFDYVIIAGGKWFLKTIIYYENDTVQGCHNCPGMNLAELGYNYGYRRALNLAFNFITSSSHRAMVMYRTITPDHFEGGEWHNGGTCKRTKPFKVGEVNIDDADRVMYEIEMEEFKKAASVGVEKGMVLKVIDTTWMSLLRPDGHPGAYRQFHPFETDKNAKVQNDCLHWCLPGPIDSWNDLVLQLLVNS